MKVTYDKKAKALYITLIDQASHSRTEEWIPDVVLVDIDLGGQVSGIEVVGIDNIEEVKDEA